MLHLYPRVIIPVSMAVGLLQVMVMEVVMVAVCFVLVRHLRVVHHHIHMWRQMRPSVIFQQQIGRAHV
jgi:hypothetical protein